MSFFDFREQLTNRNPPATERDGGDALTVSQLTSVIDRAIKSGVPASVLVKGEASNLSQHRASGHLYFTLKDAGACIDCVMFKSDAVRLKFEPGDGMELLAGGRVGVYAQRGRYQLYVSSLSPLGQGALELAFQQMRAKLEAEGLFAAERKKPLPAFPRKIALVTSRSTAALQDMLKVLARFPFLRVSVFHVAVQGDGAAGAIAEALGALNRQAAKLGGVDVVILGRGGGSLEDLWAFNEEVVARAVAASKIPVVTGIGHEVDVSIADLVADYHAHTPTEAAQVIVSQWRNANDAVQVIGMRLPRALERHVQEMRHRLTAIERHEIFRRPLDRINQLRQYLDDLATRSRSAIVRVQERIAHRLNIAEAKLNALSPQAVLSRGYSITSVKKSGAIVRAAEQVKTGDRLVTRFADGSVESVVQDQKQLPLFE